VSTMTSVETEPQAWQKITYWYIPEVGYVVAPWS